MPALYRIATILVVDDEPTVRRFVAATLESRGFTVIEPTSGPEGLKRFSEHPKVDLVLSDVLMPVMSGLEMVQTIFKIEPSVNVVFMTGMSADIRLTAFSNRRYSVLRKPFTFETLLKGVEEALAT